MLCESGVRESVLPIGEVGNTALFAYRLIPMNIFMLWFPFQTSLQVELCLLKLQERQVVLFENNF